MEHIDFTCSMCKQRHPDHELCNAMTFERERRYTVIKHNDAEKYLSESQLQALCDIDSTINFGRQQDDRGLLTACVVESDWPEYEPTWQAIEERVNLENAR